MGVCVGVPVAVGVLVGGVVPVGVAVGGSGVWVGVGVNVGGSSVGVSDGTTVGNDWVGVGSKVAVGEPTTRVGVAVGGPSAVIVGRGVWLANEGVRVGRTKIKGVGVGNSTGEMEANAANPKQ